MVAVGAGGIGMQNRNQSAIMQDERGRGWFRMKEENVKEFLDVMD